MKQRAPRTLKKGREYAEEVLGSLHGLYEKAPNGGYWDYYIIVLGDDECPAMEEIDIRATSSTVAKALGQQILDSDYQDHLRIEDVIRT